jgi:hypothetical protein
MSNSTLVGEEFYDFDSWNFDPACWDTRFLSLAPNPKRVRTRGPRSSARNDAKPKGFTKSKEHTDFVNNFIGSRKIFDDSESNRGKIVKMFKSWIFKFVNTVQEEGRDENGQAVMTVGADRMNQALASKRMKGRETKCSWSQELYNEREIFVEKMITEAKVNTVITMVAKQ